MCENVLWHETKSMLEEILANTISLFKTWQESTTGTVESMSQYNDTSSTWILKYI